MYKAIVTGASSGIGKAIYEGLKQTNEFEVLGLSRRGPDIKFDLTTKVSPLPLDDTNDIDLLVNCAGIMPIPEKDLPRIFQVNFFGAVNLTTALLSRLYVNRGMVINIASVSGIKPDSDFPIYSASKAALIAYTKSMAKRYAPRIRFNCISPGFYKTNLVQGEIPQELFKSIPLGYVDEPTNIVKVVRMLWDCKYMTGVNIVIDGGVSL